MWDYRLDCNYDIIFSNRAFHFIMPELRDEIMENYRKHTNINGINAFNVFIEKPFLDTPPCHAGQSYPWRSGMLLAYYYDWFVEEFSECVHDEYIIDNHRYTEIINQIYARKK